MVAEVHPSLTPVQMKTFLDRYALRDDQGNLIEKTVEEMWSRVAAAASVNDDHGSEEFYELLKDFKYVPGGRILASLGTNSRVTPYNCFVIPSPEDSRQGILASLSEWVEIQSRGGGVGINMSSLRPRGSMVRGVNGTSSGPIPWAHMFTVASRDVIQQGGSRRGAAMIMLDDNHPDLHEFITTKQIPGLLEGANVSVAISNSFMEAVERDDWWYPDKKYDYFNKVISRKQGFDISVQKEKRWKAREIFNIIIESAWKSGEPGIVFMERANQLSNSYYFEQLISTNPCAEQPLGPYSVCLLGSMNIAAYVYSGSDESDGFINWNEFKRDVGTAVRFNDNIIDIAFYPLEETYQSQQNIRRMGIGVMGLADAFIKLGIKYGSKESVKLTENIYQALRNSAYEASVELAVERGPFPQFDAEKYLFGEFIQQLPTSILKRISAVGIRNCFLTTQAPTGTTSQLAGVNSGIEPLFDRKWLRTDRIGEYEVDNSLWDSPYAVTSSELTPEQHIEIQSAAQKYIDSAISKTVNAPSSATLEDCAAAYKLAFKKGLKSIAYYRDQSREDQVLHHIDPSEINDLGKITDVLPFFIADDISGKIFPDTSRFDVFSSKRNALPDERAAVNHKAVVGGQKMYLTCGQYDDGRIGEIFLKVGKEGSTIAGFADAFAVTVSVALQYGVPLEVLTEKMRLTHFEPNGMTENHNIPTATSLVDYIGHYLESKYLHKDVQIKLSNNGRSNGHGVLCAECGSPAIFMEGCYKCSCGWSKCG